ncbi:hypothetical protein AN958_01064 [Leucoagaricus sp. SymC.cos]|nr:hypothetical protein AN958_01064 [Leucoagaricus sp. SymC.cos]
MSVFSGAQNFSVQGHSEFTSVQNYYLSPHTGPSGLDILLEASAPDAAVDAEARTYAPKCFPDTRKQYIHDIVHWATAADVDEKLLPMFWMRGPAGVGKSAIAQTCAERLKELGQLGAAFFFSINGRNDHRRFFPTLAYQLSTTFPDFRDIIDDRVYKDPTLVRKRMSSQFTSLIVEPLEELERRRKTIGRMAIFIDGLDECQGNDAQCEIIELIAASVRAKTTPFRWAFFSRSEPHITATFDHEDVSLLCQHVSLPISREADGEIERYLKGGFKNILRRRNLLLLVDSWPTKGDIEALVKASAGLFAYPAAVLRFVDRHSVLGFKEALQAVLDMIASRNHRSSSPDPISPFAELDAFYMLIMKRIPQDMLPLIQILLAAMFSHPNAIDLGDEWYSAPLCNELGFSETDFRGICLQLHAVLEYQELPKQLELGANVDSTRSVYDQEIPSWQLNQLETRLRRANEVVRLHHKSFYDFLIDPVRSFNFCVHSSTVREKLFNRLVERHHQFAQSFVICTSSPTGYSLKATRPLPLYCLPQENQFVKSFCQLDAFAGVSLNLVHDSSNLLVFIDNLSSDILRKLATLDYRKYLVVDMQGWGPGLRGDAIVMGHTGVDRILPGILFSSIELDELESFDSGAFLAMVQKLEKLRVIRPYHPSLSSPLAYFLQVLLSRRNHVKCCASYELGHGSRAVYWYWEFDMEQKYFHEFRALDFVKAMKIYKKEKFEMWKPDWVPPP